MFQSFFTELRAAKIPVTIREYLTLIEGVDKGVAHDSIDGFYYLSRTALVKDERDLDKFDQVFSHVFRGVDYLTDIFGQDEHEIPLDWLKKLAEQHLTPEEMAEIEALGDFDKIMEALKERLDNQDKRHEGGNKNIGTAGRSPFGAYGYNPEGVRIGQKEGRHGKAVKVWDKRVFKNLDGDKEIGTRNIKVALRRLRKFARDGAADELDLAGTIKGTAKQGWLDIKMRPERRNAVKVLAFFDIGGSMDGHIKQVEELFSAARSEFKRLEYFYFHNCLYEGVWRDNRRRWDAQQSTHEVLRTYGPDYKCIFVGDASMSPYEVAYPGGANEHWNAEAGSTWLARARDQWTSNLWINPVPEKYWPYTQSIAMIQEVFGPEAMVPMTLEGLSRGMRTLTR